MQGDDERMKGEKEGGPPPLFSFSWGDDVKECGEEGGLLLPGKEENHSFFRCCFLPIPSFPQDSVVVCTFNAFGLLSSIQLNPSFVPPSSHSCCLTDFTLQIGLRVTSC